MQKVQMWENPYRSHSNAYDRLGMYAQEATAWSKFYKL